MKKFLLLAALAASVATAKADAFSDAFVITFKGETITNGQTVTVRDYYDPLVKDNPDYAGIFPPTFYNEADIRATNITDEPKQFEFALKLIKPTPEEVPGFDGALGAIQLCYEFETAAGQCLAVSNGVLDYKSDIDPVPGEEYIKMLVEQSNFTSNEPITLQLDMRVMDDGNEVGTSTIYINFTHEVDVTLGVTGVEADSQAEYFTLQGIRIAEPQKGMIYIVRKDGKVAKHIF